MERSILDIFVDDEDRRSTSIVLTAAVGEEEEEGEVRSSGGCLLPEPLDSSAID